MPFDDDAGFMMGGVPEIVVLGLWSAVPAAIGWRWAAGRSTAGRVSLACILVLTGWLGLFVLWLLGIPGRDDPPADPPGSAG
ncbi:hypothetical protein [Alienimonas californiensis]|uniref:Uncharacterized protein n=1 Tax=Alienimonas californiensis TaxID=2527989 RepID=A0A517PCI8_9PLAN|nr:hypothetical protein [Alienimonas californiensis]QDT17093.1 hypothetical protein CA12_32050 [Alienimonas californiensis]